ncbi:MAG TPA: 5-methyltetrahydrofolate--homocysteine methyltransferase [Thermoplasmatales archaeon]|nr:5-methyltetrahydrofolate--homocysteine methyltransferase [Thermoplasmatales archaeon]
MEEKNLNRKDLYNILKEKVLLLDGSYGAEFVRRGFKGEIPPDALNIRTPHLVESVHKDYVDAGADIIITNTFGSTPYKLKQSGVKNYKRVIEKGVDIAKEASQGETLVFGDIGPTGALPYPLGEKRFDFFFNNFLKTAEIMVEKDVDGIILETFSDMLELKAAVLAVREVSKKVFLIAHLTFDENGRTLTGTNPFNFALTFNDLDVDCLGINCTLGPEEMLPVFQELAKHTNKFLSVEPNAGLPILKNGETVYPVEPKEFATHMDSYWENGANIIGGCCGTNPKHIMEMKKILGERSPISREKKKYSAVSSPTKTVDFNDFVIIGERLNPAGRKKLKDAMEKRDLEYILDDARKQVEAGAKILDVNFGIESNVSSDFMEKMILSLVYKIGVPLSLDIQTPEILERMMRIYPGRPLVNSSRVVEDEIEFKVDLIKKYGGVLIVLSMGENVSHSFMERKNNVDLALKLLEKKRFDEERVFFDPIVLSLGAGGDPRVTLETLGYIKKLGLKTVFGLSNLSFGLPDKTFFNAAFLVLSLEKGLDAAIMNPLDEILTKNLNAALIILGKKGLPKAEVETENRIVEVLLSGKKKELLGIIKKELKYAEPLQVVEKHLKPAMEKIGEMYSSGDIFLPQLILAAQASKPSFDFIEKKLGEKKGEERFVIATVKGDVHDIGKNIVAAVMRSSGFYVVDLGKDVSTEEIVEAVKRFKPKALGLSAMMTTTAPRIKEVVEALKKYNIKVVVICGGASLDEKTAKSLGADFYAKDAVDALKILKKI